MDCLAEKERKREEREKRKKKTTKKRRKRKRILLKGKKKREIWEEERKETVGRSDKNDTDPRMSMRREGKRCDAIYEVILPNSIS